MTPQEPEAADAYVLMDIEVDVRLVKPRNCPGCNAAPGTGHLQGCEVAEDALRRGVPSP